MPTGTMDLGASGGACTVTMNDWSTVATPSLAVTVTVAVPVVVPGVTTTSQASSVPSAGVSVSRPTTAAVVPVAPPETGMSTATVKVRSSPSASLKESWMSDTVTVALMNAVVSAMLPTVVGAVLGTVRTGEMA